MLTKWGNAGCGKEATQEKSAEEMRLFFQLFSCVAVPANMLLSI